MKTKEIAMFNLVVNLMYAISEEESDFEFVEAAHDISIEEAYDILKNDYGLSDIDCNRLYNLEVLDLGEFTFLLTES
jgi:hypothetical protein